MRVVFDTNIYISAILFGGIPKDLILLSVEGKFELFISEEIISELTSVLAKKFSFPEEKIEKVKSLVEKTSTLVRPKKTINVIKNLPADNRILECASEAKADYLVTGDKKHLIPLKKFEKTKIISPGDFLELLK